MAMLGGKSKGSSLVIAINTDNETIHFYSDGRHDVKNYRARPFEEEFFDKFNNILRQYREQNPNLAMDNTTLVLPDHVIITDTVNIPVINRKAMQNSLAVAVDGLYKNSNQIIFNTFQAQQNKQFATYNLTGIRKDLKDRLVEVCGKHHITVQCVTFAANAMVNGAMAMNVKLRTASALVLDIKETSANFAFVTRGRTTGFYNLPFGYNMLYRTHLAAEDVLFDHAPGELLVLNAKEKARAKRLTMYGGVEDESTYNNSKDSTESESEKPFTLNEDGVFNTDAGFIPQKSARKLPKFMQRPTPTSREEYIFENFRIFMKWALDLMAGNPTITSLGQPETVYVNMPGEFSFLFDTVNAEQEENSIFFTPLAPGKETEPEMQKLELYGGLFAQQYNRSNNF